MQTGKADSLDERPFETARREAREEIGLPYIGQELPRPFAVEHLCELPANLAKTELVVRPCVALLHSYDSQTGLNADPETTLIPRLDAREVAAVFTAPFRNFLLQKDEHPVASGEDPEQWYSGSWTNWHESNWRSKFCSCSAFPFSPSPKPVAIGCGHIPIPLFARLHVSFPLKLLVMHVPVSA